MKTKKVVVRRERNQPFSLFVMAARYIYTQHLKRGFCALEVTYNPEEEVFTFRFNQTNKCGEAARRRKELLKIPFEDIAIS